MIYPSKREGNETRVVEGDYLEKTRLIACFQQLPVGFTRIDENERSEKEKGDEKEWMED